MELLYWLAGLRTAAGNAFFMAVTCLGDEAGALLLLLVIFWCMNKKAGYYMIYSTVFSLLGNQLLKSLFAIPRPWIRDPGFTPVEAAKATAGGYSFPSGHTATVTAVYGSMARYFGGKGFRAVCVLFIILVAFSRMYLGVHTPADVGVSLAVSTALVFLLYPLAGKVDAGSTAPEEQRKQEDRRFLILQAVFLLCVAGVFLYLNGKGIPEDPSLTEKELVHGAGTAVKNAWQILGMGLGITVSHWFDRYQKPFETEAVWWAQILKVVLGIMLVLLVKECLKAPLNTLCQGHSCAVAIRYFLVVLTAGVLWPLSFRFFGGLGRKSEIQ